MKDFRERIKEKIEELADGRIHQHIEVARVINWVEVFSRQEERDNIIKVIKKL